MSYFYERSLPVSFLRTYGKVTLLICVPLSVVILLSVCHFSREQHVFNLSGFKINASLLHRTKIRAHILNSQGNRGPLCT